MHRPPLAGRDADVAALTRLVGLPGLVTVHGPAGVGKTAVAQAVARQAPSLVTLLDLSGLSDPALVPHAVSCALAARERPGAAIEEVLEASIGAERRIVLLDTCEHVVAGCAALAARLLDRCPGLTLLVTSRIPLGVPGEAVHRLRPLDPQGVHALLVAPRVAGSETPEARCARLGGLPLAVVLDEAARDGGARPPRHTTMETAIGWSHRLCGPGQRLLWARLSVFGRPFTAAEAAEVCADTRVPHVEDDLASLAAAAMIEPGDSAFVLLEPFRRYAASQLAALGETELLERRAARLGDS